MAAADEKKAFQHRHFKKSLQTHKLLAQERTVLANERNTLAYVRTGFSAFVLGIALIKLFEEHLFFVYSGWASLLIGLLIIILGLVYYPVRKQKIKSY
ncbi:hypothetical protein COV18_00090 [Candidatus Woesearchaeota archaeon CG10_big_fil_rev_8_21_14_0_10_37_12]|nr:MAG: hypothetical protein COV18_00090 [Candidatus Woesearchaeota archaeon CG10_big_fil_rev_8_21_14_0_10_37_12]